MMIENSKISDPDLWTGPDKVWGIVPGNREHNILQNLSPGNWEPEPETGPGLKRSGDKRFTPEQIQRHSTLTRGHRWIIHICIFVKRILQIQLNVLSKLWDKIKIPNTDVSLFRIIVAWL